MVASATISNVLTFPSSLSSTCMSTSRSWRSARSNSASTCASWSSCVVSQWGIPPTTPAPASTAARMRSSAPGSDRIPSCGNATIDTRQMSRHSSAARLTPSSPRRPVMESTSTCVRTWVTPSATPDRIKRLARSATSSGVNSFLRSPMARIAEGSVPSWSPMSSRVYALSRWAWMSTKEGSASMPFTGSSRIPESAGGAGPPARLTSAIRPSASLRSTTRPSDRRTSRSRYPASALGNVLIRRGAGS